jgi:hypothetical protein
MELTDFQWTERNGRFPDDTFFHEWTFDHASGRMLAAIQGPDSFIDVRFLFQQEITMRGGPFLFTDFDSAKRFVESRIAENVTEATAEGSLTIKPQPDVFSAAIQEGMDKAIKMFAGKALPAGPTSSERSA